MSDRITIPLPGIDGMLLPHVGMDFPVGSIGDVARSLVRVVVNLQEPSSSPVTVDLRTATVVLGTVTLAAGERSAEITESDALSANADLFLRVTDAGGSQAQNLSGYLELQGELDATAVVGALTTLALVRPMAGTPPDSSSDVSLSAVIAAVSRQIQTYLRRQIVAVDVTGEKHSAGGCSHSLRLDHFPVRAQPSAVRLSDTALAAGDFDCDLPSGILYYTPGGGDACPWPEGVRHIEVDYGHGYTSVPADIQHAATLQSVYAHRHEKHIGIRSSINDEGSLQSTYLIDAWDPVARHMLEPYRDRRVA